MDRDSNSMAFWLTADNSREAVFKGDLRKISYRFTTMCVAKNAFPTNTILYCQLGAVAQSVERATPGEEVPGSIHAVATRSLETEVMVAQLCLMCGNT